MMIEPEYWQGSKVNRVGSKATGSDSLGAALRCTALHSVPNKPVLPTATTSLNYYPLGPLRRQTGRPLGAERRGSGLRTSKSKA